MNKVKLTELIKKTSSDIIEIDKILNGEIVAMYDAKLNRLTDKEARQFYQGQLSALYSVLVQLNKLK